MFQSYIYPKTCIVRISKVDKVYAQKTHHVNSFTCSNMYLYYFMCMLCLRKYVCTTCISGAHRIQKRASDPREQDLQIVVSGPLNAENRT